MKHLILASANPHKLEEVRLFLSPLGISVRDMRSAGFRENVVEDGATFEENAAKKAMAASSALGEPAVADDSGLVVPALDGAPGLFSARYAGEDASYEQHYRLLLKNMERLEGDDRKAFFVCVMALAQPGMKTIFFRAEQWGRITTEPRGEGGFGYDPVFFDPDLGATYAEKPEAKQEVSHRVKTLRMLADYLNQTAG